jgi:hypothetical protein
MMSETLGWILFWVFISACSLCSAARLIFGTSGTQWQWGIVHESALRPPTPNRTASRAKLYPSMLGRSKTSKGIQVIRGSQKEEAVEVAGVEG